MSTQAQGTGTGIKSQVLFVTISPVSSPPKSTIRRSTDQNPGWEGEGVQEGEEDGLRRNVALVNEAYLKRVDQAWISHLM